jgi:hypothetical protein
VNTLAERILLQTSGNTDHGLENFLYKLALIAAARG